MGERLEDVGITDFIDLVYAYSMRNPEGRSGMLSYIFDYTEGTEAGAEDMSFDGFRKSSLSMIEELDAFQLG